LKIRLQKSQVDKLTAALRRAGKNETGGQLFGEQLAPSDFLVTEITVQARPGTFARFIVDLVQMAREATRFFDRTDHRYTRFNYIGEWHSHPSFAIEPSSVDLETMRALVHDEGFRGSFAALMIVKLEDKEVQAGAWVFDRHRARHNVDLEMQK
jgi:proteasome lid subunit RPN8/RPN11